MSNDNYCKTHKIQKTWLLTSSFCPECEKIKHGNKGTVAPAKSHDEYLDDIFGEIELVDETTDPQIDLTDLDFKIGLRDKWEAKYGKFRGEWHLQQYVRGSEQAYLVHVLIDGGYLHKNVNRETYKVLLGKSRSEWQPLFARLWLT